MMERKYIGLLTMPILDNYGGIIQVAALYHILEKAGHRPFLLDKRYNQSKGKVLVKRILRRNPLYKLFDFNNHTRRRKHLEKISDFIDLYFKNRTRQVFNEAQLKEVSRQFDTIIVGSDQVWRYKYVKENYRHYFLNFTTSNQKRVSYAASFGVDFWEGSEDTIKQVRTLLNEFDAVSVREDVGMAICRDTFDYHGSVLVLDPTFLPDVSFYDSIIGLEEINKKVGLFNYVLDVSENKKKIIERVGVLRGLNVSSVNQDGAPKGDKKPSLSEWLYHLRNADFVITDSFHGTVFSIIFNKQFIAIGNRQRGVSRFTSLLKQLGLESRLIFEEDKDKLDALLQNSIDYESVNDKLRKAKSDSTSFLFDNI